MTSIIKINNKSFLICFSQASGEDSIGRDTKDVGFGDILLFSSCISTKHSDKCQKRWKYYNEVFQLFSKAHSGLTSRHKLFLIGKQHCLHRLLCLELALPQMPLLLACVYKDMTQDWLLLHSSLHLLLAASQRAALQYYKYLRVLQLSIDLLRYGWK